MKTSWTTIIVVLMVSNAIVSFAGTGATGVSQACTDLRQLVSDVCSGFLSGEDRGVECSLALDRLGKDELECADWQGSLKRAIGRAESKGLDDPWSWGEACTAYAEHLQVRCVKPLQEAAPVEGCANEVRALEVRTFKMLQVRANQYLAQEVEGHCERTLAQ